MLQTQNKFSLVPTNLNEAIKFAEIISNSDLIPNAYKGKPGNVLVAVQMGQAVGLQPMQALQNIAVINGRPCLWGDSLLAIVKASPAFEDIKEDITDTKATCTIKRKGQTAVTQSFTLDDAKKAGLLSRQNSPWNTYPKRMLQMRARAFAVRDCFPDLLLGLSVAEEVQDYNFTDAEVLTVQDEPKKSNTDILKEKLSTKAIEEKVTVSDLVEEQKIEEADADKIDKLIVLQDIINEKQINIATVSKWLLKAKVENLADLPSEYIDKLIEHYTKGE